MPFINRGRAGATTEVTADNKTGLVTQRPATGVLHSPGGLLDASGNVAYGQKFKLLCRLTATGTGSTTWTPLGDSSPFKVRLLKVSASMLQDGHGRMREPGPFHLTFAVASATDSLASLDATKMARGERREFTMSGTGGETLASASALTLTADLRLLDSGATDTVEVIVELAFLRVI